MTQYHKPNTGIQETKLPPPKISPLPEKVKIKQTMKTTVTEYYKLGGTVSV